MNNELVEKIKSEFESTLIEIKDYDMLVEMEWSIAIKFGYFDPYHMLMAALEYDPTKVDFNDKVKGEVEDLEMKIFNFPVY